MDKINAGGDDRRTSWEVLKFPTRQLNSVCAISHAPVTVFVRRIRCQCVGSLYILLCAIVLLL